ncbi:MAG: hypothetical protein IKY45_02355 [Clostridia bacterium]|nr:hypothetical protein [Clostridia bacterium]
MANKKLTDNEIVKALECCARPLPHCYCDECPAGANGGCTLKTEDVIDLINRLQADSKRLKKVQMQLDDAMKMYHVIKAEAYKEFAEKVTNELADWVGADNCISYPRIKRVINNLLKEMGCE